MDDTHPDLAPNFDREASVNCVSGAPDTTDGAWRPAAGESDHGTHVAGTIAAAKNGTGVTGVAPGVKVSGIKVSTPAGFFYTEAVVCGFVWAAEHGVDVTNSSYYTDPWLFNCKNDPDQGALVEAVTRATRYAEGKGVVNVAAAGNSDHDLALDAIEDTTSPNDSTTVTRTVDPSACPDIPTMLPGVVTVSATGAKNLKSSYSNYGLGVIDVAAPGGDSTRYQAPDAAGRQRSDPLHAARRQIRLQGRYVDGVPARRGSRGTDQVDPPARLGGRGEGAADAPGGRHRVRRAVRHRR